MRFAMPPLSLALIPSILSIIITVRFGIILSLSFSSDLSPKYSLIDLLPVFEVRRRSIFFLFLVSLAFCWRVVSPSDLQTNLAALVFPIPYIGWDYIIYYIYIYYIYYIYSTGFPDINSAFALGLGISLPPPFLNNKLLGFLSPFKTTSSQSFSQTFNF